MFDLETNLPAEIGPLSWLLGIWEGSGVVHYNVPSRRSPDTGG
jgi:hypothetical protein